MQWQGVSSQRSMEDGTALWNSPCARAFHRDVYLKVREA